MCLSSPLIFKFRYRIFPSLSSESFSMIHALMGPVLSTVLHLSSLRYCTYWAMKFLYQRTQRGSLVWGYCYWTYRFLKQTYFWDILYFMISLCIQKKNKEAHLILASCSLKHCIFTAYSCLHIIYKTVTSGFIVSREI